MAKKQAAAPVVPKKARILADVEIDGVLYRANDVVIIDETLGAYYLELGVIDQTPEAVAYCEGELGAKARDHAAEAAALEPAEEAEQTAE